MILPLRSSLSVRAGSLQVESSDRIWTHVQMGVVNEEQRISLVGAYGKGIAMCHLNRVLRLLIISPCE